MTNDHEKANNLRTVYEFTFVIKYSLVKQLIIMFTLPNYVLRFYIGVS